MPGERPLRQWLHKQQPVASFSDAARVRVNGLRYFYRLSEPATAHHLPLLLIHGLGVSGAYWARLWPWLAASRAVYALDLPGFGRSDDPPYPLAVDELAEAVQGWRQALGIGKAHLLAHSQGAQIATELTSTWPDLTQTLTLIGPTLGARDPSLPRMALRLLRTAPREEASLLRVVSRAYLQAGAVLMVRTCRLLDHEDSVATLQRIACPTLLLRGERDPIVTAQALADLADADPDTHLATIPNAPHGVHWSHARQVAAQVNPFLAHHEPAATTTTSHHAANPGDRTNAR